MKNQVYRRTILTQPEISRLLGEDLSNVVFYNYQSKKWGATHYHGHQILFQNSVHGMFDTMRKIQEQEPQMQGRHVVLNAFKTTSPASFDKLYSFKNDVPFVLDTSIAANQIIFNEETAQFQAVPAGWFYVMDTPSVDAAAGLGLAYFAEALIMQPAVRQKFISGYQKTR